MRLWLLEARAETDPFRSWYDKMFAVIVRAVDELDARKIANAGRANEGDGVWLKDEFTTCTEISLDGPSEVLLKDVHWA